MGKTAIIRATLESHHHVTGSIDVGIAFYKNNRVEVKELAEGEYEAIVRDGNTPQVTTIKYSKDGADLAARSCSCNAGLSGAGMCAHVVAAVLKIQDGKIDSPLTLGKTLSVSLTVDESNIARTLGSGAVDVFATPIMIMLMEKAAYLAIADGQPANIKSVGTVVNIEHLAATPIGMEVTATATVDAVFGNRVLFTVTARDAAGEIGRGKHTRAIVEEDKFMARALKRCE